MNGKLTQNAIRTHDGVIIGSISGKYQLGNNSYKGYEVYGGNDYPGLTVPEEYKDKFERLYIYDNSTFEEKKNLSIWGTYGFTGNEKFKWTKLIDCDDNHLKNILKHVGISHSYKDIISSILMDRKIIKRIEKIKKIIENV